MPMHPPTRPPMGNMIAHTSAAEDHRFRLDPILRKPQLTERELKILRLVALGMTNEEIAEPLQISRETVKSELKRIFRKIGVSNRTQAATLMVKQQWL